MRLRFHAFFVVFLILVGFALRLLLLTAFPLREDEAIYGFWALHFLYEDPWFLRVWLDKPPLFIWLLSGAFALWGESAAGGRLLNVSISTLTIPLVGVTAQRLWGKRAGMFALVAMALNPFAISFAATLFTDPLLVLAGSLAFYLALVPAPLWAGFWLGVAIMTKQQGLLYLPLVLLMVTGGAGALWLRVARGDTCAISEQKRLSRSVIVRFLIGVMLVLLPIILWDSQRWAVAPSPWDWSLHNYAPLTLAPMVDWAQRVQVWGGLLWYLTASWFVWGVLLTGLLLQWWKIWFQTNPPLATRPWLTRGILCDLLFHPAYLLLLWSVTFILLHLITTLQPWDRYLLPLAPLVALFFGWLGRVGSQKSEVTSHESASEAGIRRNPQFAISILALALLLFPAWQAANGHFPIGGDHGAYSGLETVMDELNSTVQRQASEAPTADGHVSPFVPQVDTSRNPQFILYHRELGWHDRFYLYDSVRNGQIELRWYPSSVYLADNASKAPHLRKFLIEPDWSPLRNLAFALQSRGLVLQPIQHSGNFTLFEIIQPRQGFCTWCHCRADLYSFPTLTVPNDTVMICKQ